LRVLLIRHSLISPWWQVIRSL